MSLPRGDRPRPPIAERTGLRLVSDPLGTMLDLARSGRGIEVRRLGLRTIVLVADPAIAREVLVTHHASVSKGGTVAGLRLLLGDGLVTSDGPRHRDQRRAVLPAFSRKRLADYGAIIVESAAQQIDTWPAGDVRLLDTELRWLALRIAARSFIGIDPGQRAIPVANALGELGRISGLASLPAARLLVRLPIPPARRFRTCRAIIDDAVAGLVAEHVELRRHEDHVSDAMCMVERTEAGEALDCGGNDGARRLIHEQALTLLVAGSVTVAASLSWTLAKLAREPEIQAAVHAELGAVLGERLPTPDDVTRLPITRGALAEAMRLYPPAWAIGRTTTEPLLVGGRHVPRGAVIVVSPFAIGRDPRSFPDPERFDPGRWAGLRPGDEPPAYIPFGMGPRRCLGEGFAWQEGVLTLATILRRWQVRAPAGSSLEPRPDVTLTLADGAPVIVQPRSAGRGLLARGD